MKIRCRTCGVIFDEGEISEYGYCAECLEKNGVADIESLRGLTGPERRTIAINADVLLAHLRKCRKLCIEQDMRSSTLVYAGLIDMVEDGYFSEVMP